MILEPFAEPGFTYTSFCGILFFMTEPSPAWVVTERIHDLFFGASDSMSQDELVASGIRAVVGSTSSKTARRLEAQGLIDGRDAKQTLSRDKFGNFHLSTTFLEEGGEHIQADIRLESPPETFDVMARSLFMKALVDTLENRQQQ